MLNFNSIVNSFIINKTKNSKIMPFFEYKSKNIFYQIIEKKATKAIIFIHGSGESSYSWKEQVEQLNLDYSVIALDLPSHGKSGDFKKLSLELYVDVVKNLIDYLSLREVILAGHSLGGAIVQSYYLKYPEKVSGLILCSTGAKLRVSSVILNSTKNNFKEYLDSIPVGAFYRKTSKEVIEEYIEEAEKTDPKVVHADFSICDKFDIMKKVITIRVPCLIIVGKFDNLTPVKYSLYFKDNIENSELVIIDKAGHMAMLEKPEEFNLAVLEFIEKI